MRGWKSGCGTPTDTESTETEKMLGKCKLLVGKKRAEKGIGGTENNTQEGERDDVTR